LTGKCFEIGN